MLAAFLVLTFTATLAGCSPAVSKESAQSEVASFILDFIIQQEIGGTAGYIQTSGQPWVDAPPNASIIIWAPPIEKISDNTLEYLRSDEPIKVWWYADGKLTETSATAESIQKYRDAYMADPKSNIWAWGYYEFGILSMSNGNKRAEVYVGVSCGPLCGHGVIYTIQRDDSGRWKIIDTENLWIS
jgi:hypothetical protein